MINVQKKSWDGINQSDENYFEENSNKINFQILSSFNFGGITIAINENIKKIKSIDIYDNNKENLVKTNVLSYGGVSTSKKKKIAMNEMIYYYENNFIYSLVSIRPPRARLKENVNIFKIDGIYLIKLYLHSEMKLVRKTLSRRKERIIEIFKIIEFNILNQQSWWDNVVK